VSTVAVQMLTLEGMPELADLRRTEVGGQTVITVGVRVITCYGTGELGMCKLCCTHVDRRAAV
jgi:hypothetical protein